LGKTRSTSLYRKKVPPGLAKKKGYHSHALGEKLGFQEGHGVEHPWFGGGEKGDGTSARQKAMTSLQKRREGGQRKDQQSAIQTRRRRHTERFILKEKKGIWEFYRRSGGCAGRDSRRDDSHVRGRGILYRAKGVYTCNVPRAHKGVKGRCDDFQELYLTGLTRGVETAPAVTKKGRRAVTDLEKGWKTIFLG